MSKRMILSVWTIGLLSLGVAGCGDSLVSAGMKLANGQWGQLTAGEISILNQAAVAYGKQQNPPLTIGTLTTAQAAALANFLKVNNLNDQQQVEAFVQSAQNGGQVNGLDQLAAAFPNVDANSVDPAAIQGVLDHILSGK